ncbi:MAG: crossover junction endodeoxyribonuclease RuvC [Bacillota bacterium]
MRFVGIDPSGETGVTILDKDGNYLDGFEIAPSTKNKTEKICDIVDDVMGNLELGDVIAIEGFSFGSKGKGIDFQFGLGHAIRLHLYRNGIEWIEVTPSQVKKFATGKGTTKKENMILPIMRHWKFEHDSNNVRDAFVLAQVARSVRSGVFMTEYQKDVVEAILEPPAKKKNKA